MSVIARWSVGSQFPHIITFVAILVYQHAAHYWSITTLTVHVTVQFVGLLSHAVFLQITALASEVGGTPDDIQ